MFFNAGYQSLLVSQTEITCGSAIYTWPEFILWNPAEKDAVLYFKSSAVVRGGLVTTVGAKLSGKIWPRCHSTPICEGPHEKCKW